MYSNNFKIKHYPADIFNAVGQIIKISQGWEQEYKKLALMLKIPIKKISNASLNKLNKKLKISGDITLKEYNDLKNVIKIRNYINHEFFLTAFQKSFDNYDQRIEQLEEILNSSYFLIFEATDIISNKIDKLNGVPTIRPTVFD